MAFGEIAKQFAKQAVGEQVKEMLDPAKPAAPDTLPAAIIGQIQAMQKALKEDQELVVYFNDIRVVEVYAPSAQLIVLTGHDPQRALTRVITPAISTQLVCKVFKIPAGATPAKVNLILSK